MKPIYKVVLLGRPNAGKSTLFNALVGRERAIVSDIAHATRDAQYHLITLDGDPVFLTDTGGLTASKDDLHRLAMARTRSEMDDADLVLFVFDAADAEDPTHRALARQVLSQKTPVLAVLNKWDLVRSDEAETLARRMGFTALVRASALSKEGMAPLRDRLRTMLRQLQADGVPPKNPKLRQEGEAAEWNVVLLGRPNAGKSSLMNRILGAERSLVSDVPGTTRDTVSATARVGAHVIRFLDTAGLRRKSREKEELEAASVGKTVSSASAADVGVLVLDASEDLATLSNQDKKIAALLAHKGGSIVIAVNKWDLVEERTFAEVEDRIRFLFPHMAASPILAISAKTGHGIPRLLQTVVAQAQARRRSFGTGEFNRILQNAVRLRPPPPGVHGSLKVHYGVQTRQDPPVFRVFVNDVRRLPDHYARYLENAIRQEGGFQAAPIRMEFKSRSSADVEGKSAARPARKKAARPGKTSDTKRKPSGGSA